MELSRPNRTFIGIIVILIFNQLLFRGLESMADGNSITPAVVLNAIRVIIYFGLGFYLAIGGATKKSVVLLVLALSFIDHVALNSLSFLLQFGLSETQGRDDLMLPIIGLLPSFIIVFVIALIFSLIGYRQGRSKMV